MTRHTSFPDTPAAVLDAIERIQSPTSKSEVSASRYPFTYAYDYVRAHSTEFGLGRELLSRADVGKLINDAYSCGGRVYSPDHIDTLLALANAYCQENGIYVPSNIVEETKAKLLGPA